MVSHLARLGSLSDAHLRVTREAVELQTEQGKSIEKKVELPERWIRGFGEVQVYQARLVPICTISPMTMSKLFQTMKATGFGVQHFEMHGPILKPVFKPSPHSIPIAGLERLKLIQPLLSVTDNVHAWRDSEESDVSAWQLETKSGFVLVGAQSRIGTRVLRRGTMRTNCLLLPIGRNIWIEFLVGWANAARLIRPKALLNLDCESQISPRSSPRWLFQDWQASTQLPVTTVQRKLPFLVNQD